MKKAKRLSICSLPSRGVLLLALPCLLLASGGLTTDINIDTREGVKFGIEVGASYVSLNYYTTRSDWTPRGRLSFSIMTFAEIPIRSNIVLQSGLRFTDLGDRLDWELFEWKGLNIPSEPFTVTSKTTHHYLTVPISLRYYVQGGPIFLTSGLEIGHLLSAQASSHGPDPQFTREGSFTGELKRLNIALNGGIGTTFSIDRHRFHLQAQYSHGMIWTAKQEDWPLNSQTREVVICIGYTF